MWTAQVKLYKKTTFFQSCQAFFVMTIIVSTCLKYEANYHVSQLEKKISNLMCEERKKLFFIDSYQRDIDNMLQPMNLNWKWH